MHDTDSEVKDTDLREALGRSMLETRHDPFETRNTGGSSVSGGAAPLLQPPVPPNQQKAQAPQPPAELAQPQMILSPPVTQASSVQTSPRKEATLSVPDQYQAITERVRRESLLVNELQHRMSSIDSFFTETDLNYLMQIQHSVVTCKRTLANLRQQGPSRQPVLFQEQCRCYLG